MYLLLIKIDNIMESMLNIHWNSLCMPQPPQTTVVLPPSSGVNINTFVASVGSLENLLKRINLDLAGALCSRIIFKIKQKFRNTKWLQLIEKINAAMLKVLRMKFGPVLRKMLDCCSPSERQLPSRPLLEWFLLRTQGLARLLVRLVITSHTAGEMFRQCLSIGHNWQIIVTLLSLVSQIWTNCQLLLQETFKCYKVVHRTMTGSLLSQTPWSSAQLPQDLGLWIAEEVAALGWDAAGIFKICLPDIKSSTNDEMNCNNWIQHGGHVSTHVNNMEEEFEDLGEIISRKEILNKPFTASSGPCSSETVDPTNPFIQTQDSNTESDKKSSELRLHSKKTKKKTKKLKQDDVEMLSKASREISETLENNMELNDRTLSSKEVNDNGTVVKKKKRRKKDKTDSSSCNGTETNIKKAKTKCKINFKHTAATAIEIVNIENTHSLAITGNNKLNKQLKKVKTKAKSNQIVNIHNSSGETTEDVSNGNLKSLKSRRVDVSKENSNESNSNLPCKLAVTSRDSKPHRVEVVKRLKRIEVVKRLDRIEVVKRLDRIEVVKRLKRIEVVKRLKRNKRKLPTPDAEGLVSSETNATPNQAAGSSSGYFRNRIVSVKKKRKLIENHKRQQMRINVFVVEDVT